MVKAETAQALIADGESIEPPPTTRCRPTSTNRPTRRTSRSMPRCRRALDEDDDQQAATGPI